MTAMEMQDLSGHRRQMDGFGRSAKNGK